MTDQTTGQTTGQTTPQRPLVGDRVELAAGPLAHGGHVVARYGESSLVVFVRHAVPGERVVAEVTEDDGRFLRADAVEVLDASPERVVPPCPHAGPALCGGCDLQHVSPAHQRVLKAGVVREQLQRLAGLDVDVVVEEVPPGSLGWRSRMRYVALPEDQLGLRVHRSHDVVAIEECLIQAPDAVVTVESFETVAARPPQEPGARTVAARPPQEPGARAVAPPDRSVVEPDETIIEHAGTVTEQVGARAFEVARDGFWQPHVAAPRVLVDAVLELAAPRPGERVLDLYAGVGLFSAFLAEAVGPTGHVVAVEGDRTASELSRSNLADLGVRTLRGRVDRVLHRGVGPADLVVLDPPRVGAKRQVVRQVAALEPRAVVYVACDPAALARDAAYLAEAGYALRTLRALDLFPMTHHVECVALFERTDG